MNTKLKSLLLDVINEDLFNNREAYNKQAQRLFGELVYQIKSAVETIDEHCERLKSDPFYAFEWASSAVTAAAQIHVASKLLYITNKATEEHETVRDAVNAITPVLLDVIRKETLRAARNGNHSTSKVHNAVNDEATTVWADLAEKLDVYGLNA